MRDQDDTEDRSGSVRGGERRKRDRRRNDRRTPVPLWRRPPALVGYGVVGALLALGVLRVAGGGDGAAGPAVEVERLAMESAPTRAAPKGLARDAYTTGQYERLVAEGESAVGETVRAELYCGAISLMALRDVQPMNPALRALADAEGRVPGAECRWSRESRTSDFLLVVPAELAAGFAEAPEVDLNFMRRRRIHADIEWLGRSEALGLRNAGILAQIHF